MPHFKRQYIFLFNSRLFSNVKYMIATSQYCALKTSRSPHEFYQIYPPSINFHFTPIPPSIDPYLTCGYIFRKNDAHKEFRWRTIIRPKELYSRALQGRDSLHMACKFQRRSYLHTKDKGHVWHNRSSASSIWHSSFSPQQTWISRCTFRSVFLTLSTNTPSVPLDDNCMYNIDRLHSRFAACLPHMYIWRPIVRCSSFVE